MKRFAIFHSLRSFSRRLIAFQAMVIFSVVYWLVVPLLAHLWNMFGKKSVFGGWQPWSIPSDSLDDLRKQY